MIKFTNLYIILQKQCEICLLQWIFHKKNNKTSKSNDKLLQPIKLSFEFKLYLITGKFINIGFTFA